MPLNVRFGLDRDALRNVLYGSLDDVLQAEWRRVTNQQTTSTFDRRCPDIAPIFAGRAVPELPVAMPLHIPHHNRLLFSQSFNYPLDIAVLMAQAPNSSKPDLPIEADLGRRSSEEQSVLDRARAIIVCRQIAEQENKRFILQSLKLAEIEAERRRLFHFVPPSRAAYEDVVTTIPQEEEEDEAKATRTSDATRGYPLAACNGSKDTRGQSIVRGGSKEPARLNVTIEKLGSTLRNKKDPYVDAADLPSNDEVGNDARLSARCRGGITEPFPRKLHRLLQEMEEEGKSSIVSFLPHGRAFAVHNVTLFVDEIMPKYFNQSKWNSFSRQLNLYGFVRIHSGVDAGGYYHELFLRGRPNLCVHMRRVGVPQSFVDRRKLRSTISDNIATDPDFYSMKPVEG